jgi:hypothetical protein
MRLTEIIAALCVMAAAFPPLASGLRPLHAAYSEVVVLQRNLDANKFVTASFAALEGEQDTPEWTLLVKQLTGIAPNVRKIAQNGKAELFRAEWTFGGQSHCVDTIFERR